MTQVVLAGVPVAPLPGMVTLKHTKTGEIKRVFPIDSVEIMRHSDEYELVEDGAIEAGKLQGGGSIREAAKDKEERVVVAGKDKGQNIEEAKVSDAGPAVAKAEQASKPESKTAEAKDKETK